MALQRFCLGVVQSLFVAFIIRVCLVELILILFVMLCVLPNDPLDLLQPHVLLAGDVVWWLPSLDIPLVATLAYNGHLVGPPNEHDDAQLYTAVLFYGLAHLPCVERLLVFCVAKLSTVDVYHGGHAYNAGGGRLLRSPHDHACCLKYLSQRMLSGRGLSHHAQQPLSL